ncbi:unnamed protein product, partial [Polarella glacialis]
MAIDNNNNNNNSNNNNYNYNYNCNYNYNYNHNILQGVPPPQVSPWNAANFGRGLGSLAQHADWHNNGGRTPLAAGTPRLGGYAPGMSPGMPMP